MKKLALALVFLFFTPFISTENAIAASTITLSEVSHRQIDGKFFDDKLATLIAPDGRLGQLVFSPPIYSRTWLIDAALIDDVQLMANGYKLTSGKDGVGKDAAINWLARLRYISRADQVIALPYGNPSGYWVHRLSPHSESYFLSVGAEHLTKFYGRIIKPTSNYGSYKYFRLTSYQSQAYYDTAKAIEATAKYMDPVESENIHLRSAMIFDQTLDQHRRNLLARDLYIKTSDILQKIRLAPGKFTISANKQDLPITVINDFPSPANLILNVNALNSRVQVVDRISVKLDGKSRVQVKIPVEVLSAGDSSLAVGISNEQKQQLGDYVVYPLTVRVLNPVATWITYIAAVVLFISAVIQSVRRIRKRDR
jgi:hypothetical protein